MSVAFDVVVVGGGSGGIVAATIAAEAGLRVCLLDDNATFGGQIWRGIRTDLAGKYPRGNEFLSWVDRLNHTECESLQGWQAIDRPAANTLRLERDRTFRDLRFHQLILATGARERFLPFPGWTLPGVAGVGGLQALVKGGLNARGKRVVIAGTGPLLMAVAAGLRSEGAQIVGVYEQAPIARLLTFGFTLVQYPAKFVEGTRYWRRLLGVSYHTGCWVTRADGDGRITRVNVTDGRREWTHECDWLACGFHLVPNLELPRLLGCRIAAGYVQVDSLLQTSEPGIACIGELTGIGGLEKALLEGQIAGLAAAGRKAEALTLVRQLKRLRSFVHRLERTFALRDELRAQATPDTLICRCEDVPCGELTGRGSWREAKLHTRCGMGPCQGRICGAATEFLFGWQSDGVRPPVFPATVSTLAAKAE